jgi:hypothetical protein
MNPYAKTQFPGLMKKSVRYDFVGTITVAPLPPGKDRKY